MVTPKGLPATDRDRRMLHALAAAGRPTWISANLGKARQLPGDSMNCSCGARPAHSGRIGCAQREPLEGR